MSRRYKTFFRALFVAVLLAVVPLAVAKFSLDHYAVSRAHTELRAAAERYVNRAEEALSDGVTALQTLVGDGHITCLPRDHLAYGKVMREHSFVQAIDLVDANGVPMCSTPLRERSGEAIMPAYRSDSAMVGLGLLDKSFEGVHLAAVSWHVGNGVRLIAEISAPAVSVDAGPEYLRAYRRVELRLAQDVRWLTIGGEGGAGKRRGRRWRKRDGRICPFDSISAAGDHCCSESCSLRARLRSQGIDRGGDRRVHGSFHCDRTLGLLASGAGCG
ncbi:hypothetical protein [Breoghania sp. JC706]|uniref:hypothetical protein n=1 Tax=Breoghania sp. JC706 TaxID=3117732 RepID=UPI0030088A4E